MKIIVPILVLLIFLVCLFVGIQIGANVFPQKVEADVEPTAIPNARQQNFLVIQVDQLEAPTQAKFESIWILFISYAEPLNLTFKSLSADYQNLSKAHLQPDGAVSSEFVAAIRKKHAISISGYVLIDDKGIETILSHLPKTELAAPPPAENRIEVKKSLEYFCKIMEGNKRPDLPWKEIIPKHFYTNINFTNFMADWLRFVEATTPPDCNVIAKP